MSLTSLMLTNALHSKYIQLIGSRSSFVVSIWRWQFAFTSYRWRCHLIQVTPSVCNGDAVTWYRWRGRPYGDQVIANDDDWYRYGRCLLGWNESTIIRKLPAFLQTRRQTKTPVDIIPYHRRFLMVRSDAAAANVAWYFLTAATLLKERSQHSQVK